MELTVFKKNICPLSARMAANRELAWICSMDLLFALIGVIRGQLLPVDVAPSVDQRTQSVGTRNSPYSKKHLPGTRANRELSWIGSVDLLFALIGVIRGQLLPVDVAPSVDQRTQSVGTRNSPYSKKHLPANRAHGREFGAFTDIFGSSFIRAHCRDSRATSSC